MTPLASFEHMSIQLTVVVTESLYMLFPQFLSVSSFYLWVSVPQFKQQLKDRSPIGGWMRDPRELVHGLVRTLALLCSSVHQSFVPAVTVRSPRRSPFPILL